MAQQRTDAFSFSALEVFSHYFLYFEYKHPEIRRNANIDSMVSNISEKVFF